MVGIATHLLVAEYSVALHNVVKPA